MKPYGFYGEEYPHFNAMDTMDDKVEKLQEEHDVEVDTREAGHNKENAKMHKKFDNGECGGVPFFYNTGTEKSICGETDMDGLKKWAEVA